LSLAPLARAVLPLALLAALAALLAPAPALAERSDLLLAVLVLLTALGITPGELRAARRRPGLALVLAVVPLLVLVPVAWAWSRAFTGPVREGTLALGLAPTEVAAAGLVALAGGGAALALAAVAGSLVACALVAPALLAVLGGTQGGGPGELVGGFALVVLVPLVAGLGLRAVLPGLARVEQELAGASALVLAGLVYLALSAAEGETLGTAALAAAGFLALSAALAVPFALLVGDRLVGGLAFALRDFAVAAGLAAQAFGPEAAAVAGVYGVLMLVLGAAVASAARRVAA
jgi:predicted Na+-dependent transporter